VNALYLTLLFISAATLAYQILLTRFFSLAHGSHMAFMAISLALLGAGASGSFLFLRPSLVQRSQTLPLWGLLFTLSLPMSYLIINYIPFDTYRLAWERRQLLWFLLYYLAVTVPFFFSGLIVGSALTNRAQQAGPVYAANLIGSGLGPPLALLSVATVGGPGTIFFCTLLGWLGFGISAKPQLAIGHQVIRWGLYVLIAIFLLALTYAPPAIFEVRLTPYKALSQAQLYPDSNIIYRRWNAFSRVDVIQSEGIRSAPGLSFTYPDRIPPQLGLTVDGDNLVPITGPADFNFTQYLPLTLGFVLRPQADVLILEPGGGLAVLAALQNGAKSVTVVQSNPTVAQAVSQHFANFTNDLYNNPRVTLVIEEPRSFLRRTGRQFDLIVLPLTDSFRPVTAGAYTLNEDYRYTTEAFSNALAHLSPDGLLVIERWLQLPPSESLRIWATMIAALKERGETHPDRHLLALRSMQTSLIAAGNSPLISEDLAQTRQFATDRQFDLVWLPDIQAGEVNRFSILPHEVYHQTFTQVVNAADPADFYARYLYAVAPATDDHPYFFHFFKWQQIPEIWQSIGKTWQPFGGSGYLVLVGLLILVLILGVVLILLPLLLRKDKTVLPLQRSAKENKYRARYLTAYLFYFALLGLGFLFVEIPLLQRFILYLGQPAYAFAAVVSILLIAAGIGSRYFSGRLSLQLVLPLIAGLTIVYPLLLPYIFDATLHFPFWGRVGITVLTLFPLGTLMGIPFPCGLKLVNCTTPALVPWVWAVNGCASVISAVLAAMVALTGGFSTVLWGAAVAYGLTGVIIYSLPRVNGTKLTPPQL
jgi:spermidine synthase